MLKNTFTKCRLQTGIVSGGGMRGLGGNVVKQVRSYVG